MLRVGLVHHYLLLGSGSCLYVRMLAEALGRRGHAVHVLSAEQNPAGYPWIKEAYVHQGGDRQQLFRRRKRYGCVSHTLLQSLYPTAYLRWEMASLPTKLLMEFTDRELDRFIADNVSALQRIASQERLDLLNVQHTLLYPYIAKQVKEQVGIPYIVTVHGTMIEYVLKRAPRFLPYAVEGYRGADAVVVLNEDSERRVLEIDPTVGGKIVRIPVGVKVDQFKPLSRRARPARARALVRNLEAVPWNNGMSRLGRIRLHRAVEKRLSGEDLSRLIAEVRASYRPSGLDEDVVEQLRDVDWERDLVLGYVGKHLIDKGIHCLLAAFPLVLKRFPNARLLLMGNGIFREGLELILSALDRGEVGWLQRNEAVLRCFDPTGQALDHLLRFLERGGRRLDPLRGRIRDRVIFPGYLSRERLRRFLPLADLCVIPSIIPETFPLVSAEAMAAGVLPVGSDLGGLKEILGIVGERFPEVAPLLQFTPDPDTAVESLAGNLIRLLEARPSDEEWQERLHSLADERYSCDRMAIDLVTLYRKVLKRPPPPGAPARSGRPTEAPLVKR